MAPCDARTILVIEDSDDDFFAISRAFAKAGLKNPFCRCSNGDQAINYLFRTGEYADLTAEPRPALTLLDLNLPGLDGREILRQIKSDNDLRKIPVIVLTTSIASQDIERCYEAGANTYVQKPVDLKGWLS